MKIKNFLLALLLTTSIPLFAQEPDMTIIPYRQGDLWGYADQEKNIIIKPEYQETNLFYQGFAVVKKGGKYGYINTEGKVVIPIKYFSAKPFQFGFYEAKSNSKSGDVKTETQKTVLFAGAAPLANGYEICIDTKGIQLVRCPAISENSVPENNKPTTVTVTSNYSTIQKSELFDKITGDYKIIDGAEETYYIATRNNNYGVFNNKFEVIVPFEYTLIEKMKVGAMVYLKAQKAGLNGILFGTGSPYLAVENTKIQHIIATNGNSYFIFTKEGKTGVRNTRYENIIEARFADVVYDPAGGFILTDGDIYKGLYFLNQNILLPRFAEVKLLKGGQYVLVKTTAGKWGYVNSNLIEFFED